MVFVELLWRKKGFKGNIQGIIPQHIGELERKIENGHEPGSKQGNTGRLVKQNLNCCLGFNRTLLAFLVTFFF
jgi:hypothetical protein